MTNLLRWLEEIREGIRLDIVDFDGREAWELEVENPKGEETLKPQIAPGKEGPILLFYALTAAEAIAKAEKFFTHYYAEQDRKS